MPEVDKQIIEKLVHEEHVEHDLVQIYSALIELDVTACFPESASEKFGQIVRKLRDDSKKHFAALAGILKKYE